MMIAFMSWLISGSYYNIFLLSIFPGLVINFSVDSDPVLCEQKRKKLAGSKHGAPSELKSKNF